MKKKTMNLIVRLVRRLTIMIVIIFLTLASAQAQPDDNGGDPTPNDVPVDGGITWLAAGGTAYAYRILRGKSKSKS